MKRPWWIAIAFLMAMLCSVREGGSSSDGAQVTWFPCEVRQGDVVSVRVQTGATITTVEGHFNKTPIYFYKEGEGSFSGIVGVDMAVVPGRHSLQVVTKGPGNKPVEQVFSLQVAAGGFEVQRLTLAPEMVDLQGEILKRYQAERKRITEIYNQVRPLRLWHEPFIRPIEGQLTSTFGLRRVLNGQDRSQHNGVDIGAPLGAEVGACNKGIVVLAQELCLEGNTIILDHGFGLYSIYMHLSELRVKEGDTVESGACIGLVGATGRVTGPHLHWGVRLLGARVDPFALLRVAPPEG
jgi:murein DD-endopeptidase MepM/ murein hydrolase activator NlpD